MMEQAHQYKFGDPDVDPFDENIADQRVANHALQIQTRPDAFPYPSVPLFLSDPHGKPDPRSYLASCGRNERLRSRHDSLWPS